MLREDLFGGLAAVGPPPVRQVELYEDVQWRPAGSIRTACGHCQMLHHRDREIEVHPARWARTDRVGAVLYLCTGHREQQEARDMDTGK